MLYDFLRDNLLLQETSVYSEYTKNQTTIGNLYQFLKLIAEQQLAIETR